LRSAAAFSGRVGEIAMKKEYSKPTLVRKGLLSARTALPSASDSQAPE